MQIFNGKEEAEKILEDIRQKIGKRGGQPKLAVILVGKNPASQLYIKLKKEAASRVGILVDQYDFEEGTAEKDIIDRLESLNQDDSVDGILLQLPLPQGLDEKRIIEKIAPEKDVDGFSAGKSNFIPVLPNAILTVLKAVGVSGKKIVALVNSEVFGKTLKSFLAAEGLEIDYTTDKTNSLAAVDVIITVCGSPGFIRGDMIKEGVVLVDAGITLLENKKVAGDVDRESVERKASFLTPVPGGIGPLTVALLLKNVYLAKYGEYSQSY